MKKSILLLAAAGCLVLPVITHADTPATKKEKARQNAMTTAPVRNRVIYYISTEPATGSQIPMVRRSYNGYIDSAASPAVYGSTQIQQTGQLDVGSALYRLDPSISLSRGR